MNFSSDTILLATIDDISVLTLNRPDKCNAMNEILIADFIKALDYIVAQKTKVLIVTANGNHFCSGADIQLMQKMAASSHEANATDARQLATLLKKLYLLTIPTIALLKGFTLGGGLGLAACCDIAIAADNTTFGFSEAKLGLTPSVISPYILSAIGERATRYYYLTAQRFGVEEAYRLGLIHQIVTPDTLESTGVILATEMLQNSPHALLEAKKLIHHVVSNAHSDKLTDFTVEHLAMMRKTPQAAEGLQAFLDKRPPKWV
jgi:methylglutaconyl-CoA hydratase